MKKFRRAFITLLLALSVFATSVFAAPSASEIKDKKEQAENEIESLKDELADIMADISETEMKLISKGEEIIAATEQLAEAEANEQKQHEDMVKRIVAMYENGNTSALQLLLESRSISDMLQKVENVQALHEYDRKELQKYIDTKEQIAELKVTLEEEQAILEELQASLEDKKASLDRKIAAKKKEIKDFDDQLAEIARKAAEEADRKRREEADQEDKVVVNNVDRNSSGGVKYTGTGDQSVGNAIVAAARSYIGVWYEWGGNDRNGIDCSGLTKACHKAVGIYIDRWSGHQAIGGKEISGVAKALPGDIICYSGHVAIYIGNERVIHAPRTGKQVQEAGVYMKEIIAIRRYW